MRPIRASLHIEYCRQKYNFFKVALLTLFLNSNHFMFLRLITTIILAITIEYIGRFSLYLTSFLTKQYTQKMLFTNSKILLIDIHESLDFLQ